MQRKKKVFVHLETTRAYSRDILAGIYEYNNRVNNWEIILDPAYYLPFGVIKDNVQIIQLFKPDGCILENQQNIEEFVRLGIPVIQASSIKGKPKVLFFKGNYNMDGKMAFDYFLKLGFKTLGFFGADFINFSERRYKSFKRHADSHNIPVYTHMQFMSNTTLSYQDNFARLVEWLKSLPTPIGIFACNDDFGQTLISACSIAGVKVPYEIAILGVDNDELLCKASVPNLSSISRNVLSASFKICSLLDRMMNGEAINQDFIETNPLGVVERQSTNIIATEDKEVAKAIIYIREHCHMPIAVQNVVKATNLSRRTLHSKFKAVVGHSINDEIQLTKLNKFKNLLRDNKLSIKEIAFQVGFDEVAHISRWFSSLEGMSPTQWKAENM